jgi:hypothetical protein
VKQVLDREPADIGMGPAALNLLGTQRPNHLGL